MANIFDDPFSPADTTAADAIFNPAQPRTVVSPGLTSFDQNPLDDPMSGLFNYDEPIDVHQNVRTALSTDEQEAMDDVFDSFLPKDDEDSIGLLSSPKNPKEGPTEFQKRNINWSDGGRDPDDPVAYKASDVDFLETDYMFGKKEGASDKPVLAANVFGRQFTAEELNRDTEGRKLLDLMQKRRSGEYQKGGVLANLAKGFTDWSKSDIPYYGWVSDIGASAGEAIEISETMRRLQDGKIVTPHQVLQARRFMLQQELEAQRTAAYQIGAVARQAIPFMAEMFAESMAVAGIVGAATGGVGAIPGAIAGAAIAPAKLLFGLFRKSTPKAIAKVTDKAIARYAAKGLTYGMKDLAEIGAKGTEVYGSRAARREALRAFRDQARKSFADAGVSASERQISTEATRLMADALSRRAPENLSPRVAARMIYGADYRTGAETAITKGLEEMALKATGMDAAEFAKLSGRARAKKIAEGWAKIGQADRDSFLKSLLEGLKRDAKGNVVSGIKGFSSASVKGGMESTTGLLVSEKYARSVADQVARQVMNVFDLRYGDRTLSHFQRFGGWFGEHVTRGFLQSEHAYFAGGLPTIGHAGFSSFHLSSDALKEGLGRVFVEAPIQGAMNAAIGPLAMAPIFAAASGHDAGDAVFKGQLGFQANALLTGDRKNMETARQCAIGSLFVEYMSESAGRGLGLMAGGALASNPVARAVLGTKANPATGTTASIVGATRNVWDAFLSQPLTKQAGSLLSRATEAVYGFGRMGVDKYAGLATTYVTKLVKAANKKGVAGTVTQAEIRNAVTSNSFEGLNGAVRGILAKEGIRNAKQLARRVALDASQGDRIKALTNVLGLRLAQRGLTPDEIVRKFRQMGKGNIIEEMGEERLGDFVRGLFHLDDTASDADINEHLKSMFSGFRDPEQLMVEFFGFAWPGIVRGGMMRAQRWISTGALAEARERSQRIQNVMDIMGSSNAAISVMADERRKQAIEEHTARGAQLLADALGTAEQNGQAVVANSKATFDGRANLVANVQAAGGLQAPASNPAGGSAVPGTSDYNNSMAKVQAVAAAKTEAETVDEMAKLAQSYMQYSTEAELEDALRQTGAEVIFGTEGVKAIRREWRKVEGHSFAAGHEVEQALDAYKTHMNTAPARAPVATTVDGLANQVRVESPIFASDSGLTANQRDGLSQDALPLVDEGIVSQLDEDLKELARNVNRAALSIDGDLGWARKTLSKIVGLVGAASTGDISLAMMNPAAWAARDSGLSPQMLVATNGYYVESLIEGFKKLRVGENGLETKIAEKLNSVVEAGGNFAQAIRRAVESGELSAQTFDAMEAAGADLFDSRVKRLAESVLAGSGILMVAQDQQNEAVLSYVANRHRKDDGDGVAYVLKDGTTVDDFHDGRFAADYADEIQKTRDDLVDELLRLAGDRDALRFQRGAMLGADRPFFAIDVVRAIKNGTKAEMLGAILSLPAFRDMAKVLNVSGLTEYERETLFSAMNCKDVDLTALANIDDSKDLDGKDEAFVASAMGRNNSKYTAEENQKAMKDFVRRCRLLYRGGLTTFEDRDGEGRVARIVPENVAGTRAYRAVVYKAGATLLDQTYTDFVAAQKAVLDFGVETDEEGEISKWGFSEVPKNLVISDLNVITSTDSTSMVSYLFANDREELRRQYLYRIGGMEAVRSDMLVHDPTERTLPPYLRRKPDRSGWQIEGPDAAQKAAQMFRDELERARFYERNKGNVQLWGRGQSLTTEQRREMMKDDAKVAESVKSYEALGDRILEANGVHRTATPGNQTLGLGNAWTAHLNYTTVRNGNTMVISPDFASDGHSEGMLRFGIRQALDSWRNLRDEDSTDRNLLLAYAYREFKRCGEELASRLERTDRTKAQRVRDVMRKVLRDDVAQIHTSSIAAIASSSVFFSCDRGLMQEGNGFLDSPELAAIADAFRATDVFPLFASAIDEALGGTGFFHQAGAGSVSGLSAWADAFGRDGLALAKARTSTVFGDGKSARNPALVRYAIRADVTTPDMLDAGPITVDRKPGDQPTDIDSNGLINSFGGENALMDYLKALSDSCVRFTEQYAGIRGASDVRLTTAQVYRMAVRSNMLGGAATASGGARAKVTANLLSLNTAAINEARNVELKGMPYELTPETAQHIGAAMRRIALSAGMSVTRGRTRLVNDLRNRNVPEDIIAKIEQAYNDTDLKSDLRRFGQRAEEGRRKAKEESDAQDALDEAESGRSDDGFKEERNIGGLVDNDDTTALSRLLRWYFPWEGGSVSATLSRVRESLLTGDMLTDEKMDRLVRKGFLSEKAKANVKRFVEALSVLNDKTRFDENNAKSVFWSEDAAEVSEVLDDVTRVLSTMGKYDYAVAVAAIRNIPHNDGRRTKFLQMLAQMTVTDPVYLERDGEFNFSLDNLGTLVESDRTPNAIQDVYTSLLAVNTLTATGAKLNLTGRDPESLAKGICDALAAISYRRTADIPNAPTQWEKVNDLLRGNFVDRDSCPTFKYPGGKASYYVAVDAKDLAAVQAYLSGGSASADDARQALDNIQALVWKRMQNMAEAVDRIFGTGTSLATALRSRDALAYVRRQADKALTMDVSRERAERNVQREMLLDRNVPVPEADLKRELDRLVRIRESGIERLLQMANYFATAKNTNKGTGMWNLFHCSAFLSDVVQEPLAQLALRLGGETAKRLLNDGYLLGSKAGELAAVIAKTLAGKEDARQFVREQLRDIGMMKAATGRDVAKALTPEMMDTDRDGNSMFDSTRVMDDQCLKVLIDAYVSSLPQSSRSLTGHAANRSEAAKNRSVMMLPSDLPADIRMECHELFNDAKVDGKSLREILEENGGRWADGSRSLVTVVGAKDVDGTLVPKEYLAGVLDRTIRSEFENGNPTHVLLPFFRADKPSCFAIRMPVRVATEWVKAVAADEKLMANLRPELAERIRTIKDSLVDRPLTRTEKPKKGKVSSFHDKSGKPTFLSNMFEVPIEVDGIAYRSLEAAFQAQKVPKEERAKFSQMSGKEAKAAGRAVQMTPKEVEEWNNRRLEVMYSLLQKKFDQNPELMKRLLASQGYDLEEGNTWGDVFWGTVNGKGENNLGKLLMKVRDEAAKKVTESQRSEARAPEGARPVQTVDRDSLYRAIFGLAMTAAGQAEIDPKRVATTLSVGPYVPLYKPSDESDRDAACYFVSTLGGVTAASLTGAYQIVGRGSTNVKSISEGRPEAQKLHITSHTLGVNFKKGQGNDYGLGFDRDGQTTTLSSVTYYQEQGRRELERILGLPEKILDPVDKPKASKDKDADKAKFDEWTRNVKAPHDDAVAKAKAFLDKSTVVLDDLETNKAGIFGSSFGFFWDGKSVFAVSISSEKTNATTGEKTTETTTVSYDPDKKAVTDGNGNPLSGGWNVIPDAKNSQMPVMWVLSALCMAKKDGRLTNADVNGIVASWRKQNGAVVENATLGDLGVLADGDEFNVRDDGNGNAVVTFKTRNISAQVVANNANSAAPEYGHSFATNATRDMEMLEEISNAEHGTTYHDFVNAHAGYSMLKLAMLRGNPDLVSLACGQDRDLVEAYKNHPFDPEVRDTVAKKVNAFLRRESIIGFYGTHGVMCPSAGNGHSPVRESRGGHTVQIEWLPGTTQYDKDVFRPARIYNSIEEKFYGQSRGFGSGCVNVRAKGFRYGLYLDEAKFDGLVAGSTIRDDFRIDAAEWAAVEGCSVQEAEKAVKLANFIRIAIHDEDARVRLLDCFVDYTGRSAAQSEGSRDARFDDLVLDDGKFDLTAIGIGRSRRDSVNERDSAEGSIYLGGSLFCAHRSPSGNIEAFQGTVRATAPISFDARTGRVGGEAKYALDPVTMLLQGSDTDGDSAGLQYWDYEAESDIGPEAIREFVDAVRKGEDAMNVARRNGWTETVEGYELVKEDVFRAFTRAAFKAQADNYRHAKTFHQGQQDGEHGVPQPSSDHAAPDVWSGAEFVDYYEDSHPELLMTRGMDNEFVCDYGWAGRQPVGTDAVWDEPVEAAALVGLSKKASDILASLGDVSGMGYDKLLKKFVDAAKYGEKTSDLLDPEKSAMLSDAASDSAKARGISVFHQSRFLRALARAVVDDAKLDLVSADGYAPIIDLTSHFDGISNNLFDTLKMMFATRAGWTQQMLPFLLGQIVRHASGRERLGNAFFFVECANFLADLTRESTVSRLARYLHPTQGRQNILADAKKAKLKVSNYDNVTEIAEAFCRAKKIKIRDGVDKNGNPRSVTPRGKKALIVCANRMVPMTNGFDIEKSKPMQDKEREMLAIQGVLDDVREFGELVDYMVDAGRDTSGQYGILRKLDDVERDRSEVEEIQEYVVENFADFSTKFTDSVAQIEQLSRELDDLERPDKGEERAKWYAERREHPVATGVDLAENMQRLSHLVGATQYAGAERASDFGRTTREFVENFADAIRYLSNEAWRRYDGSSNRLIGRFFRALEAKDGRIDVRAKQNEARVDELRAGFDALLASGHEFTMRYRRGDRDFTVKLPGSAVAALLMVHASMTRPFGATTSYAGQSNLAAAFGDERIRGLESFATRYRLRFEVDYVRAVRIMPVRVGGAKVYNLLGASYLDTASRGADEGQGIFPRLDAKDHTKGKSPVLEALDNPREYMEVYRHLADNFGAKHKHVQSLRGRFGEHVTVTETHYAPTVSEWAGRELQTRTRFYNVADSAIKAFHAYPGSKAYSSPEEAYNARLALEELNSLALEDEGEVRYLKEFYRDNGNRADADSGHKKVTRLTDIVADAAASDKGVYSTIANGGRMYLVHPDPAMTEAMNRVKNMIVDGSVAEPGAQQAKARMASEQGGHTDEDAMAVRADFLDRIADTGFRGASAEQLKKTIPQAIADGFKKAFGDQVDVSQVKNANGEPTNLLKVVRTLAGGRKITTYVSYGDVLGMDNVSRDSRIESILDMLNGHRAAEGRKPLTRADLEELSGHDLDALIESFRLAGCQAGQSEDAADLGFAPVMSGVIRLSTDAGFDTLFHEYFHQMLKCFSRFGVYDAADRADLESRFRTSDGAFDEEAAADAYARFVTGSANGWDELKLRDYCATDERTIRLFDKFRTTATGLAEAMSRGPAESGLPTFVFATMFFGELTDEQAARFAEPSDEQLAKLEDFLLKQRGQFAMTTGMDAGQLSRVQQGVANLLVELTKDTPDRVAVKAALDGVASVASAPVEPAAPVAGVREGTESYETIAGKTSQFLKQALTRFRRDGYNEHTEALVRRYMAERVNGAADASEVVYAARRLIREVAALEGYVLEDEEGNLTSTGKKLLDDHNVAELAMRLIANTEEERQSEAAGDDGYGARHAGADFTFARAMEHVAPRSYWRFCRQQAGLARTTFMSVADRLEKAADALDGTTEENSRLADSYRLQAEELRGLALRVVPLAMHVANGDDLHGYCPLNKNSGNLHGLLFKMFTGGAQFGDKHGSSDGISRYDASLGSDFHFDLADPTITAAFDYAAMAFFVAEAARKYSGLMDLNGRDRTAEGVGGEVEETPETESEEPVAPEIAEGGTAGREREIEAVRQARQQETLAELTYEPSVTPDWILSNPGTWLDQDLQRNCCGTDIRGTLTDHNVQAVCEEGYSWASMFNQTFGLETWIGDQVREMKRKTSDIGMNEEGDFAKVKGKRAATVFSNVNGTLLGMIAWGEKRVGEKVTGRDIRMANWVGQVVKHLAARERRMITGVEIRSLAEDVDLERLSDEQWRTMFSPEAVIRRHMQSDEQKRLNPETALDVMLFRILTDVPAEVLGLRQRVEDMGYLGDQSAGGLYYEVVETLARGKRNAEGMCDYAAGQTPAYQSYMVRALEDKYLVAKGGGRNFFAVPLNRSMAAWKTSEMYRKLKEAGRTDQLLNPYYWANTLAKQFRQINQAAAKSRYLTNGAGSNITLAGTTSYWFFGGTGSHVMNVQKYQNAMQVIGDAQANAEDVLRKKEATLFDIIENVDVATLNDLAFASDGSSLVKDRPLKYLAYMMGLTGHDDSTFDVQRFVRDICAGKYANADHGVPLYADMKVLDVYMAINRFVSERTLEELARTPDLGPAKKQDLVDRMAVTEKISQLLQNTVPGTIVARTEEQEFAETGRLGDSATAGEALVRMCKEVVTAERFRGGLAQMLLTVANDGTPNYIVDPTDAVVAVAGLEDEYWGALARFTIRQLRFRFPSIAYDEGKTGVENMRAVYTLVKDTLVKPEDTRSEYHQMNVTKMRADRMFSGILARSTKLDAAGNDCILTDLQKGEADCYMRQLFAVLKAPSIDSKWQKLDRLMSWTKISSVGFSAFFNIATVFESATAATGFWHTVMGMTKTGSAVARGVGRAIGRKGGTGAFTSDAMFMKDLAQYVNSDDPFVRKARELCDLIGMPLDFTLHFTNDRDNANPGLGQGGVVKGDIEKVVRWAEHAGFGAGKVRLLRKSLQFMYEHPTDYTFNVVLNAVKLSVVMQTMRRLREECLRGARPFDAIRELRRHSAYINAEIGGVDPARYAWATPEMRKILSLGMFSWQWTVGAWVAGGGEAITDAVFGGHSSSAAQRQRSFIRWLRMLGIVKFGVPVFLQAAVKALSKAMSAGLPPDDELAEEIDKMPWFCPLNESKVGSLCFDVTPLLKLAARVPGVAWTKENVPVIGSLVPAYVGGGRNTTGKRRYYMHFGKQSDEFFRWFEDPLSQALAKTSIPVQKIFEGVFGGLNPQGYRKAFAEKGLFDRVFNMNFSADENALVNLISSMTSFSSQSISANPDAGFLAAVGPMKMGESKRSARLRIVARLREFIEDDRTNNPWSYAGNKRRLNLLCTDIFREAQLNGIPPDKILSSALGDLAKEQYAKLMDALPKDLKVNRIDGEKAVEAIRALTRANKKYSDIKSSILQKYEAAGHDLKTSPAMRKAVLDVIRAARRDPLRFTGADAEDLVGRYRAIIEQERRSTQMDDKGGENFGNFLATDDVPSTLFGVPVVTDRYARQDLEFFKEHPKAGGFYEMGDEEPGPEPPDRGPGGRADDKGGDAGRPREKLDVSQYRNAQDRAVAAVLNKAIDDGRTATGREMHAASFAAYADTPGAKMTKGQLKAEAKRRWRTAQEKRGDGSALRNDYTTGKVTHVDALADGTDTGVYDPGARQAVAGTAPREEFVGHPTNNDTTDRRTAFARTFGGVGARITNKDAGGNPIDSLVNYVASAGDERNAAMSSIFPYAAGRTGNTMQTAEDLARFWKDMKSKARGFVDADPEHGADHFTDMLNLPWNGQGLVRAYLEADARVNPADGSRPDVEAPEYKEAKELLDWLLNPEEMNKLTMSAKAEQKGTEVA